MYDRVLDFTIKDILALNESLTSFNNYVVASGLDSLLDTEGPFTVFAPNNSAMVNLPISVKEDLDSGDFDEIFEFVRNHIVNNELGTPNLTNNLTLTTSSGFTITVTVDSDNRIFINDSEIILRNLQADNGVVHIIDHPLYTEDAPSTIYEYISRNENHSVLANAINKGSLDFLYDGAGPLTLFAPTNQAFANLPDGLLDDFFSGQISELVDLILSHTLNDSLLVSELVALSNVENANLENLSIIRNGSEVFVNDARIVVEDIKLDNGIIHVIDLVILDADMKNTVLDVVRESDDHDNLLDAIILADQESRYEFEEGITLFAPTDAAINMLPPGQWSNLLSDPDGALADFLAFHTLQDSLSSVELTDGLELLMSNGVEAYVARENFDIFINNAKIVIEDIIADNGIVHVIDAVMEEVEKRNTVYDLIANDDKYSILKDALIASGLDQTLINETSITYFAPTDLAFNALPQSEFLTLLSDPDGALKDLLEYHLFEHNLSSNGMFDGLQIAMANGETAIITDPGDGFHINNSKISDFDNFADNGIVHAVNAIINPIESTTTVYDVIASEEEITIFHSAVDQAELETYFRQADLVSVFAPSDNAFQNLPPGMLDALLADPDGLLTDLINYHHFNGLLLSGLLNDGDMITMVSGQTIELSVNQNGIFLNDAKIIIEDIVADNGVVHVLDAVIMPKVDDRNTVYDIIANSTNHNTLEAALIESELDDMLIEGDGLTVFAPTDAAFNALPAQLLQEWLDDPTGLLRNVLLNHVYDGTIGFSDLQDGNQFVMESGLEATISLRSDGLYINDARIEIVEINADNGIVHVINAIIEETEVSNTIYDIVSNSSEHIILKETIDAADLADRLSQNTNITLFAPTDAAFNTLSPGFFMTLINDPDGELRDLLTNHIYEGTLLSSGLSDGTSIDMSGGLLVHIFEMNGDILLNESTIITRDVQADNGIVHVIDAVLMPLILSTDEPDHHRPIVYPNPGYDIIFMKEESTVSAGELYYLLDSNGKIVRQIKASDLISGIDISALPSGSYLIVDRNRKNAQALIKM